MIVMLELELQLEDAGKIQINYILFNYDAMFVLIL